MATILIIYYLEYIAALFMKWLVIHNLISKVSQDTPARAETQLHRENATTQDYTATG